MLCLDDLRMSGYPFSKHTGGVCKVYPGLDRVAWTRMSGGHPSFSFPVDRRTKRQSAEQVDPDVPLPPSTAAVNQQTASSNQSQIPGSQENKPQVFCGVSSDTQPQRGTGSGPGTCSSGSGLLPPEGSTCSKEGCVTLALYTVEAIRCRT